MTQEIKLEIIDDQVKVISPYNEHFVRKARNFRGKWKNGAWWFDDSIIDYVRDTMIEIYGTTGEKPYEKCSLLIKNYTDAESKGPVTLFDRTIAKAFGRDSGAKLGDDIILIEGTFTSGGSVKNWTTYVENATFEIQNFPVPRVEKEDVQKAIEEGWCEIIIRDKNNGIKELKWNDPKMYATIAPYAMDKKTVNEIDYPVFTNDKMEWFLKYDDKNNLLSFCSAEYSSVSITIKNFYAVDNNQDHKFEFINYLVNKKLQVEKIYCMFKTGQVEKAKKKGFEIVSKSKNWNRLMYNLKKKEK